MQQKLLWQTCLEVKNHLSQSMKYLSCQCSKDVRLCFHQSEGHVGLILFSSIKWWSKTPVHRIPPAFSPRRMCRCFSVKSMLQVRRKHKPFWNLPGNAALTQPKPLWLVCSVPTSPPEHFQLLFHCNYWIYQNNNQHLNTKTDRQQGDKSGCEETYKEVGKKRKGQICLPSKKTDHNKEQGPRRDSNQ